MDAIIERYNSRLLTKAKNIAVDNNVPIYDRIIRVVMAMNVKSKNEEVIEHLHKPQNALMHQKIQNVILTGVTPILAGIIQEGIQKKIFDTQFPFHCVEMILAYANAAFDDSFQTETNEHSLRIRAFVFNIERLLGAQKGSFSCLIPILNNGDQQAL